MPSSIKPSAAMLERAAARLRDDSSTPTANLMARFATTELVAAKNRILKIWPGASCAGEVLPEPIMVEVVVVQASAAGSRRVTPSVDESDGTKEGLTQVRSWWFDPEDEDAWSWAEGEPQNRTTPPEQAYPEIGDRVVVQDPG